MKLYEDEEITEGTTIPENDEGATNVNPGHFDYNAQGFYVYGMGRYTNEFILSENSTNAIFGNKCGEVNIHIWKFCHSGVDLAETNYQFTPVRVRNVEIIDAEGHISTEGTMYLDLTGGKMEDGIYLKNSCNLTGATGRISSDYYTLTLNLPNGEYNFNVENYVYLEKDAPSVFALQNDLSGTMFEKHNSNTEWVTVRSGESIDIYLMNGPYNWAEANADLYLDFVTGAYLSKTTEFDTDAVISDKETISNITGEAKFETISANNPDTEIVTPKNSNTGSIVLVAIIAVVVGIIVFTKRKKKR